MCVRYDNKQTLKKIRSLIVGIADVEHVKDVVAEGLQRQIDPVHIVNALSQALDDVGKRYERGEYYLSELMMVGILATEVISILKPYLIRAGKKSPRKIIIGTVEGDLHDIGKNIVIIMLRASGFEVVDLGVDVAAKVFSKAIERERPDVLGLSALLTSTMGEMRNVMDILNQNGLRDTVRVIVGGRPITKNFAHEIGADGYAEDALAAVKLVKELIGAEGGIDF